MNLLAIDIGTTHAKAGWFGADGRTGKTAVRKTTAHVNQKGETYFDPEELWGSVASAIREVLANGETVAAVGIASMAETGLLIDRRTGKPRSFMIPWFDRRSLPQAEQIAREDPALSRFSKTGLHPSFKYGLTKILWLKEQDPQITFGAVWLSAADYIAYRLTGVLATDYTLAARTYAFRIDEKSWDESWIRHFGLKTDLFPEAVASGQKIGETRECGQLGLADGIPVAIAGHDHVCAALAVGAVRPQVVFDSIGTAETLMGIMPEQALGAREYKSGLSYGIHVLPGYGFWMGGCSASGGSVEWMRAQLGEEPLSYEQVIDLLGQATPGPTGIFYYPYLAGSGAPHPNPGALGALLGLRAHHTRSDLLKAILEGTAYEMESIRRTAERVTGTSIRELIAVGGGTKNRHWMQIKADISGCELYLPQLAEATLLGAAMTAGIGCGIYRGVEEASILSRSQQTEKLSPNPDHHAAYRRLFEQGYVLAGEWVRRME
ncbi:FGGY-family carbohydrate kinase [Lihuaxuella thermophila]|uniref:Xylulokinase n=1 Tax=Lihuaxuella thermophila TaxID=1173111 RepID=A0A1H8G8K0_9BACL|nr:FGGY family carbohydrate kinase [Lihuaxuella thermophila]SEN40461.1 xylulokinase [Lihuaxuella thermophila]